MTKRSSKPKQQEMTLIGVLASHDDRKPNESLVSVFTHLFNHEKRAQLDQYHFLFTGGTYDRVFYGNQTLGVPAIKNEVRNWLMNKSTRLPSTQEGGVIVLSYFVSQRECSIVWPFFAPNAAHWQRNENLAFMRLCDQWHVKRLMNRGSVLTWFDYESATDCNRNLHSIPPELVLCQRGHTLITKTFDSPKALSIYKGTLDIPTFSYKEKPFSEMSLALIAHDEMKARMVEFAIDHEKELNEFKTILATGTTGREVAAATSEALSDKIVRYHSGPKGGDIEIATAILYDQCDVVIFFVDPLRPHPHIEDIRVVFQACMVKEHVVMITNERHARDFMSRVVRAHKQIKLYE